MLAATIAITRADAPRAPITPIIPSPSSTTTATSARSSNPCMSERTLTLTC